VPDVVYTRDVSSGRIHKRYPTPDGKLATLEGCNLDDAGAYEIVDEDTVANADHDTLCRNDFPDE
jgi:hypothetical protein